mgnify:CR=1 FL=1
MSQKKGGGSTKNLRDSNAKYLGIKRNQGVSVKTGEVLVRQRGTKIIAGSNVKVGKDHTLFAEKDGVVNFRTSRKKRFDGKVVAKKTVDVVIA